MVTMVKFNRDKVESVNCVGFFPTNADAFAVVFNQKESWRTFNFAVIEAVGHGFMMEARSQTWFYNHGQSGVTKIQEPDWSTDYDRWWAR